MRLFRSFKSAISGIKEVLVKEVSFKLMLIVGLIVIFLMFYFPTKRLEKVALLTMIFAVLTLELINSTIERVLDFLEPKYNHTIKEIKDLTAGIVLVISIGAGLVGLVIFLPYFKDFFQKIF